MSNYGIRYMGSKAKICEKICSIFPGADNFYDLFGGGFSVTHFMIQHRSKDYKHFHFNEIRPGVCDLVKKAINGDYSYDRFKPEWVSREDFMSKKETDAYIKIIWSFGNNGESYLFGKDIEQQKRSMHMAVVFNEFDDYAKEIFGVDKFKEGFSVTDKRLYLKNRLKTLGKYRNGSGNTDQLDQLDQLERLERLDQLQRLQRLQQLQQLQQLERLERLNFYNTSYENILIKENSVIYCDIPYKDTADYGKEFSHEKFFDWAHAQKNPVYISEYNVSDKRFKLVYNMEKNSLLCATENRKKKIEKVYVNESGYRAILEKMRTKDKNIST